MPTPFAEKTLCRPSQRRPWPRCPANAKEEEPDEARLAALEKLKELYKARQEAAKQNAAGRMEEFVAGRGTLDILLEAQVLLLRAELCSQRRRRIASKPTSRNLAEMTEIKKIQQGRFDTGRLARMDLSQAEFFRLEAEIELLREKMK